MQIIDFEPSSGRAGDGTRVLARFAIQVTPDLRLCGLRLVETPKGRRTYFPPVNGGGRSSTASVALSRAITDAASLAFKGHEIANDQSSQAA
jgi:hypothetical protein